MYLLKNEKILLCLKCIPMPMNYRQTDTMVYFCSLLILNKYFEWQQYSLKPIVAQFRLTIYSQEMIG